MMGRHRATGFVHAVTESRITDRRSMATVGLWLLLLSIASAYAPTEAQGVCAKVRVQLSQDIVISRNAFRATLEIGNDPQNFALENLRVVIDIRDGSDQPSNDRFGMHEPELSGIADVNGSGTVQPGTTASATWLLVPSRDAAPEMPTQYYVGGSFSYTQSGETVTIPLFPAPILVKPDPLLVLDYFLVRDVYSDDPFTPGIEPAEPFPLGLMVRNNGKGVADNFRISTSEPKIVENEKGLLIDFKLVSAQVNADLAGDPSLTLNLGDIDPGAVSVAKWTMTASLQGKFTEYKASFTHVDGMGNPRLSLIDAVNVHELTHAVRVEHPSDDRRPDFLVNDISDEGHLPDTLYNSDASVLPVLAYTDAVVTSSLLQNHQAVVDANVAPGWVYIRATDPGGDDYRLVRVVRSDGREVRMDDNAWTTHRTIRLEGQPSRREHFVHIFDQDSTGSYTLFYEPRPFDPDSIDQAKLLPDGGDVALGGDDSPVVTAQFPGAFYVEQLDRSSGIRIAWSDSVVPGDLVNVHGTMGTTADFERQVLATSVTSVGRVSADPLGIVGAAIGGSGLAYNPTTGAGQRGTKAWQLVKIDGDGYEWRFMDSVGANNIGLLVKTWGKVTAVGTDFFYLDDGSGYYDTDPAVRGVKVVVPSGTSVPAKDSLLSVTAISSCYASDGNVYRLLRVWRADDVVTLSSP